MTAATLRAAAVRSGRSRGRDARLARLLVDGGAVPAAAAARARRRAAREGRLLDEVLLADGLADARTLLQALESVTGVPAVDLSTTEGDPAILGLVPRETALELGVVPLWAVGGQLTVAVADPSDLDRLDALRFVTGRAVQPCVALRSELRRLLERAYRGRRSAAPAAPHELRVEPVSDEDSGPAVQASETERRPIVRLVDQILIGALEDGASDIHLEPTAERLHVRQRVDGLLHERGDRVPLDAARAVISRLKVLARLDIAEQRRPQDGRLSVSFRGRQVDVRVSTLPTVHGEKAVLRLLDQQATVLALDELGLSPENLRAWRRLARGHEGLVLACGPTGSGKTTTLHATLAGLARPELNLVSLEDPVEYEVPGVSQAQVNERAGLSFASGLRAILRQDPDIVLVGEVRDAETARIALQASLTGHFVLSTLHSNDAASAITRLLDIGAPAHLVAGSLRAVLAQRLVRRACRHCLQPAELADDERDWMEAWIARAGEHLQPSGCVDCEGLGYRGRLGVHELLEVDEHVQALVAAGRSGGELAAANERPTLWQDGLAKVRTRETTLRELARVVRPDAALRNDAP